MPSDFKEENLPTIYQTWIGSPCTDAAKSNVGHDIIGPRLMAKFARNPLIFCCQITYRENYCCRLMDSTPRKKIQKYVEDFFTESILNLRIGHLIRQVKKIVDISLDEKHGSIRDCAFVKDIFTLSVITVHGGYVLDTNVVPEEEKEVRLPFLDHFHVPSLSGQPDMWMMYSPGKEHPTAIYLLQECIKKWDEVQKMGLDPTSKAYYLQLGSIILDPIREGLAKKIIHTWLVERLPHPTIRSLNILKMYFNTHHHGERTKRVLDLPPLLRATHFGHAAWLKELIVLNFTSLNVRMKTYFDDLEKNEDAVSIALRFYHLDCLMVLLEAGASIDLPIYYEEHNFTITMRQVIEFGVNNQPSKDLFGDENRKKFPVFPGILTFSHINENKEQFQKILDKTPIRKTVPPIDRNPNISVSSKTGFFKCGKKTVSQDHSAAFASRESKPRIVQELKDGYNLFVKDIGILPLAVSMCQELANRMILKLRF